MASDVLGLRPTSITSSKYRLTNDFRERKINKTKQNKTKNGFVVRLNDIIHQVKIISHLHIRHRYGYGEKDIFS